MRLISILAFATLAVCALCQPTAAGQAVAPHVHHVVRTNSQVMASQRLRGQSTKNEAADKQVTATRVYHIQQKPASGASPHVYHVVQKGKKGASVPKASQSKLGKKVEHDDELDASDLEEADEEAGDLGDDEKNGESDGVDESELEDAANQTVGALLGSLEDEAKAGESEDSELEAVGNTESDDEDATDDTSEEEEEDEKDKKSKMLRRQDGKKTSEKDHEKAPHKNKSPHFKIGDQ